MQRLTIVRYKVKPDHVTENEALSRAVFDRVRRDQPQGVTYGLFREADGQSFTHVFVNMHEDNSDAVTALPEFEAFGAEISARCEIPPEVTRLSVERVDSYGFSSAGV
jgi:quinol monooxygenase YgiN